MRAYIQRHRGFFVGAALAATLVVFFAFRPDKLFVNDVVDESLADAFAISTAAPVAVDDELTPTTIAVSETPATVSETSSPVAPPTTHPGPFEPVLAATGSFYGIDHSAAGTTTVYEQDGRYVLRFEEDTDIQNGPDLYVWVLPADDYDRSAIGEHIDLAKLKGNVGGQNYELPDGFDPSVYRSVLIWCKRFAVPFAAVPLQDA